MRSECETKSRAKEASNVETFSNVSAPHWSMSMEFFLNKKNQMWDGAAGGRFFFWWFQVFHSCLGGEFIKKIEKSSAIKPHTSSGNSFKERNDFWNKKNPMAHLSFFFGHWKWFSGAPSTDRKVKMFQGRKKKVKIESAPFFQLLGSRWQAQRSRPAHWLLFLQLPGGGGRSSGGWQWRWAARW